MPVLSARDVAFVLHELIDVDRLTAYERFADHGRQTFDAALATAERIAVAEFLPHNRTSDLTEPVFRDGKVEIIPQIPAALEAFRKAGFFAAHADFEHGGMQLPWVVAQAAWAWFQAANLSTYTYPFLTVAAANLLAAFGSESQKARFLPHLLSGRFCGTMALSEPQAGSSLADVRTAATPEDGNGLYRLTGSKMWISCGEHDLADNIVHMMLARIRGAPAGVKGLSLFLVPKYRLGPDGEPAHWNGITLLGLNHKMGYRGATNTVLDIGNEAPCYGELVGAPGEGLKAMFHMMNEARIGVGMGAIALASAGYRFALGYARERRQGRLPGAKDPAAPPVRLVDHADVRRMLLVQKAVAEGGLAVGLEAARLVDVRAEDPDPTAREDAHLLLEILTPIVKAYFSDRALEANDCAIQVLGGYGYTRDFPVEQHWRDNRLNPIHEGTNGIQAIDLLGRKIALADGRAVRLLTERIATTVTAAGTAEGLNDEAAALSSALARVEAVTAELRGRLARDPEGTLAHAVLYMEMAGHLVLGWIWLKSAVVAAAALARAASAGETLSPEEAAFYRGKIATCRFVVANDVKRIEGLADRLLSGDRSALEMRDEWF